MKLMKIFTIVLSLSISALAESMSCADESSGAPHLIIGSKDNTYEIKKSGYTSGYFATTDILNSTITTLFISSTDASKEGKAMILEMCGSKTLAPNQFRVLTVRPGMNTYIKNQCLTCMPFNLGRR